MEVSAKLFQNVLSSQGSTQFIDRMESSISIALANNFINRHKRERHIITGQSVIFLGSGNNQRNLTGHTAAMVAITHGICMTVKCVAQHHDCCQMLIGTIQNDGINNLASLRIGGIECCFGGIREHTSGNKLDVLAQRLRQYKNPPIPTKQEQIVVPNNSVLVLVKAS